MYEEELEAVCVSAQAKTKLLKEQPARYMVAALLGGFFVGVGVMVIGVLAGLLAGQPYMKMAMGFAFSAALSLVIFAGGELFTGNNMVMAIGSYQKKVTYRATGQVWIACYIGNWAGSIIAAVLFVTSGLSKGAVGKAMAATAAIKMNMPPLELFTKAILCNILVCLAVWCCFRCKSESGKLIMIFWCIFVFNVCGFEHCIANMTYLTIGLLSPFAEAISIGGYFYNILIATVGNIVGGAVFVGLPYYIIGRR